MKNSHIMIAVVGIILIGSFIFLGSRKNNSEVVYTAGETQETNPIIGCYVATLGKDVYTLSITSQDKEFAAGTLSFKNFEKDSSSGTLAATYKEGILLGDYTFDSEGSTSVMQVIFKKTTDGFVRGYGEVDSTGTSFADLGDITYDEKAIFKTTPCSQ